MEYSQLTKVYLELEKTSKRLEKKDIIADFFKKTPENDLHHVILLLQGRVFPHHDERKIGMSSRLILKVIAKSAGVPEHDVEKRWKSKGDLGEVAEELITKKKQATLANISLTVKKVFDNIAKLAELEGKGTVGRKIDLVSELLTSASPVEARFVVRTVLEDLRVGVADGLMRDSIAEAYNADVQIVERAFDILLDFGEVAKMARNKNLGKIGLQVGKPLKSMLAIKVDDVKEAFEAVGKPALFEEKLDGFRVSVHKKGNEIKLFTRSMENVTKQFAEVIPLIKSNVKCKDCILDSEFVGYDPKTKKYLPFQHIGQRIRRKYDIEKIAEKFPVEINVFDLLHYNGKDLLHEKQEERRRLLEKIIEEKDKKIVLTKKLITGDEKEASRFFKKALKKGHEGLIVKNLEAEYQPGRRVGGWVKLKSSLEPLDLAIIGGDWGAGKRVGVLSSFVLGCRQGDKFLSCGMMGTGIKEKSQEGVSFKELTKLLKPLIFEEKGRSVKIRPKVVVEVGYEEIQKSPTYESEYALRFPRLIRLRNDKPLSETSDLTTLKRIFKKQKKS